MTLRTRVQFERNEAPIRAIRVAAANALLIREMGAGNLYAAWGLR